MTASTINRPTVTGFNIKHDDGRSLFYSNDGNLHGRISPENGGGEGSALVLVCLDLDGEVPSTDEVSLDVSGADATLSDVQWLDRAIATLTAAREALTA